MYLNKRNSINRLTRFLAGSTSPEEDREIRVLIDSDPGFRNEYEELEKVWKIAGTNSVDYVFDTDKAWANLDARILSQSLQLGKKPSIPVPAIRRYAGYALKVAAVLLIGLAVFQLAVNRHPYQTIASGNAIITPVSLADGSTIYLNSASSINYPEKFGQDSREVYFWGEAFFEIAHDPSRPFIIETGETRVKVLGTSFNIRAYPETGQVDVIVKSGKVLFYHVDKSDRVLGQMTLLAGEKGVYERESGRLTKLQNDEPNYLSWKTGILVFEQTSLDKVLAAVGKKYGVTFNLAEKDICNLKLTATFDNDSLDAVLEVLKLVHNLQFVNNGKDYLVSKNPG